MIGSFNIHDSRRENGVFIFQTEHGEVQYKSLQCAHCGVHWQVESRQDEGGWCLKCMKPLCSKEECYSDCVPYEAQIEIQEGNKKTIMQYKRTMAAKRIFAEMQRLQAKYGDLSIENIIK